MEEKPTERQKKLIVDISKLTNVEFDGSTYQEACEYIDTYLDDYNLIKQATKGVL